MKYFYCFEKIHFWIKTVFSKNSRILEVPHIDPLIISKTKLSHENDWSFILIHFVFWWTFAEIIKNGSELNSSSCGHSDIRMDQSLNFSKKVLEMTFLDRLEGFQFGWLKIKGFYVAFSISIALFPNHLK